MAKSAGTIQIPNRTFFIAAAALLFVLRAGPVSAQTLWRFGAMDVVPMGTSPGPLLAADLTNDGSPDLLVANTNEDTITLRIGNGDGSFGDPLIFSVGDRPAALAAGDVNEDGLTDIVVGITGQSSLPIGLSILLGSGGGDVFQRMPDQFLAASGFPSGVLHARSLAISDFNHDDHLDLAIGSQFGLAANPPALLWTSLGIGNGTFAPAQSLGGVAGSSGGITVGAGDLTNDGYPEAIGASYNSGFYANFQTTSSGGLRFTLSIPNAEVESAITSLTAADFDDDGFGDVATANVNSKGINIFYAAGTSGRFLRRVAVGDYIKVTAADLDGDGTSELAAASATGVVTILKRSPLTQATFDAAYFDFGGAVDLAAADFDGDGRTDLAALTPAGVSIRLQRPPITATDADALEAQVSELQEHVATRDATIEGLEDKVDELTAANLALQDLLDDVQADLDAANEDLADLQGQLDTANGTITDLTTEREDLAAANGTLQGQLNTANRTIASLTTERDSLAAANTTLQGQLNTANGTVATLTTERDSLSSQNATLQTQLASANQAIADLEAQLANATASFTAQITALQQTLQAALADPAFAIPGATPQEQIQNLVTAIDGLNPGQKQALYKNLGGKKK